MNPFGVLIDEQSSVCRKSSNCSRRGPTAEHANGTQAPVERRPSMRSRSGRASKRSILVPLCGGLAAFTAIGLGQFANHPEDFTSSADAVAQAASDADPHSDSLFTHRSPWLIRDAVRVEARAAEQETSLEQVQNALERDNKMDQPLRSQGPTVSLQDSTEGPVLPLEP